MANKTVTEQREQVIAMLSELKSYNKTAFKKLDSILGNIYLMIL